MNPYFTIKTVNDWKMSSLNLCSKIFKGILLIIKEYMRTENLRN